MHAPNCAYFFYISIGFITVDLLEISNIFQVVNSEFCFFLYSPFYFSVVCLLHSILLFALHYITLEHFIIHLVLYGLLIEEVLYT